MTRLISYFFILLLLTAQNVGAQDNDSTPRHQWYVPHYVPVQFAGNIGLFSLGVGYSSNHDNYHINFLYGYVPSSVAGTEIHTITAKNIFPLTRYGMKSDQTLIPYLGIGLTVEVGGNAFLRMPSHYPEGYKERARHRLWGRTTSTPISGRFQAASRDGILLRGRHG